MGFSRALAAVAVCCLAFGDSVCSDQLAADVLKQEGNFSASLVETLNVYATHFERRVASRRLLATANEPQLLDWLAESHDIASTFEKRTLQADIFRRLAMVDPVLALDHAAGFTWAIQQEFISAIFGEWSSHDPDAAAKHAAKLALGRERLVALRSILSSLDDPTSDFASSLARELGLAAESFDIVEDWLVASASRDPEYSWDAILNDSRPDSEQLNALSGILTAWIDRDGPDVLHIVNESSLPRGLRARVIGSVLKQLSQRQPRDAFQLATDLYDGTNASIFRQLLSNWAQIDPSAALDALSKLASMNVPRSEINALRDEIVWRWTSADPVDLLNNASKIPRGLRASEREHAVEVLSWRDPEEATNYLGSIRNREERQWVATGLVQIWAWKDVDGALDWALNAKSEFGDDWQTLVVPVLKEAARSDPERALQAALEVPFARSGIGLESDVVEIVARSNLELAEAMLPQMRNDPTLQSAVDKVAIALALNGETDRAFALAEMLEERYSSDFRSGLVRRWARRQPQGLFSAMDSLPSAELKAIAAESLVAINEQRTVLHDDQFEQVKLVLASRGVRESGDYD